MSVQASPTPMQLYQNGHSVHNIARELEIDMENVLESLVERDAHLDGDGTDTRIAEGMRALLDEYNLREIGEQVGRSREWVRQKLTGIGIDVSCHTTYDKTTYSEEECVGTVIRYCNNKGENEYPYANEYNDWRNDELPSKANIMEYFDTWHQVLRAAQMPTKKYRYRDNQRQYTEYEVIEAYDNLHQELDREPTADEIDQNNALPNYQTFITKFNGKSEVNDILGYDDSVQTQGRNSVRDMHYYDNEDIILEMVEALYYYRQVVGDSEATITMKKIDEYWDGPRLKYLPKRVHSRQEIREIGFRILDGIIDLDSVDWSQHNAFKYAW